jgi:fructose PTS system EIIBC or EIIC component
MKHIVAVTSCPAGIAHTLMAAEALKKAASVLGHEIAIETQGSVGTKSPLSESDIARADVVILASDVHIETARFAGKLVFETRTSEAIRNTNGVIEAALALVSEQSATAPEPVAKSEPVAETATAPAAPATAGKRLVGITACPTGIAHTFMAAEALQKQRALSDT